LNAPPSATSECRLHGPPPPPPPPPPTPALYTASLSTIHVL
jgi:hypothetical protein